MTTGGVAFPFSAVVGQDDLKLGLVLCAVDPRIGGVLLRGQKGSAKSTLARALAVLMPGDSPFVELPVGATEDRLIGSIDLQAALTGGRRRFQPGLLAAAHGGVLYVDEVNLLPDHLVDVLLDVAASGVNRVEREGISEAHPSHFVLAGSMNPEEGELRPQLLDRFGLAVEVTAPTAPEERAEAVRRRLAFDADPEGFGALWAAEEQRLRQRLAVTRPAAVEPDLVGTVSAMCASLGAEGLRADLVVTRAAAALAGWEGRQKATVEDVRRVAPLALAHRRRRSPFEEPGIGDDEIEEALNGAAGGGDGDGHGRGREQQDGPQEPTGQQKTSQEKTAQPGPPVAVVPLQAERA
nr:AAA family ATPase [Actinomycetota bacterium]